jgi:hypothetical protein
MKVKSFTSILGDEFLQPLFVTSQSLHPRVVFLTFSVCELSQILYLSYRHFVKKDLELSGNVTRGKVNSVIAY